MESRSQSMVERKGAAPVTVLVVEDDECLRTALTDALRAEGYGVEAFAEPAKVPLDGVDHVDIVLTDYRMPGQNGLEFADAFHALHPGVPVILITGDTSACIDKGVSARPFTSLRHKPFGCDELRALIRGARRSAKDRGA